MTAVLKPAQRDRDLVGAGADRRNVEEPFAVGDGLEDAPDSFLTMTAAPGMAPPALSTTVPDDRSARPARRCRTGTHDQRRHDEHSTTDFVSTQTPSSRVGTCKDAQTIVGAPVAVNLNLGSNISEIRGQPTDMDWKSRRSGSADRLRAARRSRESRAILLSMRSTTLDLDRLRPLAVTAVTDDRRSRPPAPSAAPTCSPSTSLP